MTVALIADYDAGRDGADLLQTVAKDLVGRNEVYRNKSLKVPDLVQIGFRFYHIGRYSLVVRTLSQMTYDTR